MTASASWTYQKVSSAARFRHDIADVLSKCVAVGMLEMTNPAAGATTDLKNATTTVTSIVTWLPADLKSAGITKLSAHGARALTFTTGGGTSADAPANVVITGLDINGAPLTETLNLAQTAASVTSVKCYSSIISLVMPAADGTGTTVAVGIADKFGLPSKAKLRSGGAAIIAEYLDGALVGIGSTTIATNQAATAVNLVATATNQAATATNQAATATNQAATATNQAATATNQTTTATNQNTTATNQATQAASFDAPGVLATKAATDIHAAHAASGVNDFPGAFTNPTYSRNVIATFGAGWDGGNVTVNGTDQFNAAVTETLASNPGTTRVGVKIFKTVTSASKSAVGASGDGCSLGMGDKIGTLAMSGAYGVVTVDGVFDASTWDATYHAVTPTSLPDGSRSFVLLVPTTHTHLQDAHNHTQDTHNHLQDAHNHTQDTHNHTQDSHNHTQDSHNHTQDSHNHTQDSHNHTQNSHNHTQDAHTHNAQGTYTIPASSLPFGAYTPATTPNGSRDYAVLYEEDVS
jgi:hypothetical protein